jgi:Flp pilus assembly protein CpaB
MNRNRLLIGIFIALVLAFLTSSYVYRKFKEASFVKPALVHQTIVVAAMPLPLGTRLDASKLREIPWPAGEPVQGMFTKLEECTNRALITAVAENEPILEGKLAPIQSGAGLPATIPEGMRGLSVAVNEVVGVAGFVGPGTMVDVLATGKRGWRPWRRRQYYADHLAKCACAGGGTKDRAGQGRQAADRSRHHAACDAGRCGEADHGGDGRKNSARTAKHN